MASSDYDTYGSLKCKEVLMDVSGLTLHDPADDTKKLVVNASALSAGTATLTLPTASGALLSNQSTLSGAKLSAGSVADAALATGITATKVDLAGAAACTDPQDTDNFWIDDAGVNKKITGANLKTFVNAGQTSLPSSTDGQVLVSNGADNYESATMSGDCTIASGGAVSIGANKITTAMLQNDSVDANKLANNAVDSGAIAANAVVAGKYGAGSIVNADVSATAGIAHSKLANLTSATILVGNATNVPTQVAITGDISLTNGGVTAIGANKVTTAMLQNDSVDANKLANNAVDSAAIAANAVVAGKYGPGSIVNADVNNAAAIAGSKVDPDFGAQTVETTGDFQTAANKAFRFGADSNGSWRMVVEGGGGSIRFEKKESGTWNLKGSFSA